MSYRRTWSQIKNTVGIPIRMSGTHPNLLASVNEACEVLWNSGDWIGKFQRWRFKIFGNGDEPKFVTWPRQIEAIESVRLSNLSIGIRNAAFEFVENATGDFEKSAQTVLGDNFEVCSFDDIDEEGEHRIKVESNLSADNGSRVLLLGYDQNGKWIRTEQGTDYADGEILALNSGTPPISASYFSKLTGIQFLDTPRKGRVELYQVNEDSSEKLLGEYDYNEEVPVFRRSILSGIRGSNEASLLVLARMRFIPTQGDRDYVQIGSVTAISNMLIALQKRDNGKIAEYANYQALAEKCLEKELEQYHGSGAKRIPRVTQGIGAGTNVM